MPTSIERYWPLDGVPEPFWTSCVLAEPPSLKYLSAIRRNLSLFKKLYNDKYCHGACFDGNSYCFYSSMVREIAYGCFFVAMLCIRVIVVIRFSCYG